MKNGNNCRVMLEADETNEMTVVYRREKEQPDKSQTGSPPNRPHSPMSFSRFSLIHAHQPSLFSAVCLSFSLFRSRAHTYRHAGPGMAREKFAVSNVEARWTVRRPALISVENVERKDSSGSGVVKKKTTTKPVETLLIPLVDLAVCDVSSVFRSALPPHLSLPKFHVALAPFSLVYLFRFSHLFNFLTIALSWAPAFNDIFFNGLIRVSSVRALLFT